MNDQESASGEAPDGTACRTVTVNNAHGEAITLNVYPDETELGEIEVVARGLDKEGKPAQLNLRFQAADLVELVPWIHDWVGFCMLRDVGDVVRGSFATSTVGMLVFFVLRIAPNAKKLAETIRGGKLPKLAAEACNRLYEAAIRVQSSQQPKIDVVKASDAILDGDGRPLDLRG